MKTEHFMVSTLDFCRVFKTFFPKFELLNSGCGLSASLYGILMVYILRYYYLRMVVKMLWS